MTNTVLSLNKLLLNSLSRVDRNFFLICGIIIVVIALIYFLIPVFRKEQYKMQRDNLREREKAFNAAKLARDAEFDEPLADLSAQPTQESEQEDK